jgi:hypothetical protein
MTDDDRYVRITLRIPRELHAKLEAEADRTSKSLNAEIVGRVEETFNKLQVNDFALLLARLERDIAEAEFATLTSKNDLGQLGVMLEQTAEAIRDGVALTPERIERLLKAAHWAQDAGLVPKDELEAGFGNAISAKRRMAIVTKNWVGEERAQAVAARFDQVYPQGSDLEYRAKPSIVETMFGEVEEDDPPPVPRKTRKPKR